VFFVYKAPKPQRLEGDGEIKRQYCNNISEKSITAQTLKPRNETLAPGGRLNRGDRRFSGSH